MKGRRRIASGALVRRIVQIAALLLFFGLVLSTRRHAGQDPPASLQVFFLLDPLVLLLTWLSAHAIPAALWLSLVTVGVTLVSWPGVLRLVLPAGDLERHGGPVLRLLLAEEERTPALVGLAACQVLPAVCRGPDGRLRRTLRSDPGSARVVVSLDYRGPSAGSAVGRGGRILCGWVERAGKAVPSRKRDGGRTAGVSCQRADPGATDRPPGTEPVSAPVLVPVSVSPGCALGGGSPTAARAAAGRTRDLQPVRRVRPGLSRRGRRGAR